MSQSELNSLSEIVETILRVKTCAVCEGSTSTVQDQEFVELCGCLPKNFHVHLKCIRELVSNDSVYLSCPNRACSQRFSQYVNNKETFLYDRKLFDQQYGACLAGIFVDLISLQIQQILFYNLTSYETPNFFASIFVHSFCILAHLATMILLFGNTAEKLLVRYYDRQVAINSITISLLSAMALTLFSMQPLFLLRHLYTVSVKLATWIALYCICIVPTIAFVTVRENARARLKLSVTIVELRKIDTFNLANYNGMSKKTTISVLNSS